LFYTYFIFGEREMTEHLNVWVEMSSHELLYAAMAGCQRRVIAMGRNRPQYYGAEERMNYWQIDIQGAISEYALAKSLNMFWEPATNECLKDLPGDVGEYQIRSTSYKTGHLIVHSADNDEAAFIFAIIAEPYVKLAGYLMGHEAKAIGEKHNYDDLWVHQSKLRSVTEILPIVESDKVKIKTKKQ